MISDFIKINEELFININFINAISKETLLVWLCGDEEGIKIAPAELAAKFSIEGDDDEYDNQFGFHGFSWTNIDKWIDKHPEYPIIVGGYKKARAAHFERIAKRN